MDVAQQIDELGEAEARLRQIKDVRKRARRASAAPFMVLMVLGVLFIARGMLLSYWPRVAWVSTASLLGMVLALLLTRQWMARHQDADGILRSPRIRQASVLAAISGALIANMVGVSVLITGVTASMGLAAAMGGFGAIAIAIAAIGAISDALYLHATPQWVALIIYGVGLVAVAVAAAGRYATNGGAR